MATTDLPANPLQFSLRALLIAVTACTLLLAAAAQVHNLVWWVLVLSAFYVPFIFLCLFVRRKWWLIGSVALLHTVVVAILPVAFLLAFGSANDSAYIAAIALIDVPLLPLVVYHPQ